MSYMPATDLNGMLMTHDETLIQPELEVRRYGSVWQTGTSLAASQANRHFFSETLLVWHYAAEVCQCKKKQSTEIQLTRPFLRAAG